MSTRVPHACPARTSAAADATPTAEHRQAAFQRALRVRNLRMRWWQGLAQATKGGAYIRLGGARVTRASFAPCSLPLEDPGDRPDAQRRHALAFPVPEDSLGCSDKVLESAIGIPEDLASRLVGNPDIFTAVFFLSNGAVIAGTLQLAGEDLTPTR